LGCRSRIPPGLSILLSAGTVGFFYEELNLFGFNKFWNYPQTEEPLLWRAGRRYYYKGEFVAEAKGGNIYEKPQIKITDAGKNPNLEPIDTIKLLDNCF